MEKIIINKQCEVSRGGISLTHGLVQGDKYRFWDWSAKPKYLNIQVCKNGFVVFSYDFYVGSKVKVKALQKQCMDLFNLEFRSM